MISAENGAISRCKVNFGRGVPVSRRSVAGTPTHRMGHGKDHGNDGLLSRKGCIVMCKDGPVREIESLHECITMLSAGSATVWAGPNRRRLPQG